MKGVGGRRPSLKYPIKNAPPLENNKRLLLVRYCDFTKDLATLLCRGKRATQKVTKNHSILANVVFDDQKYIRGLYFNSLFKSKSLDFIVQEK